MRTKNEKAELALYRWSFLAFKNGRTDAKVNDLLEDIAGDKYLTSETSDDPIWETIQALDEEELDEFLAGCDDIAKEEKEMEGKL